MDPKIIITYGRTSSTAKVVQILPNSSVADAWEWCSFVDDKWRNPSNRCVGNTLQFNYKTNSFEVQLSRPIIGQTIKDLNKYYLSGDLF